ncbi:MAG: DnaJ domain-containing protein, partial [Acidobacteriota bacterium]|nr:DnaJ domain-containing protein [Acidobacteriota bacterium]
LLPDEQLQSLDNSKSDLALAAALSQNGLVDRKTVVWLISNQVVDVLRVALLWPEGGWEFDARPRLADPFRVKIDLSGLLLQATRKMQPQIIAARLPNRDEIFSPAADLPDATGLLPTEGFLFSRLENPLSLSEWILLSGLSEDEALRTIYGLAIAGFVKRLRWPGALTKERPFVAPAPTAPDDSSAETSPSEVSVHTLATDMEELFERLQNAASFYEVLKLGHDATPQDIKNSYYALARRYHPDLFHMQAGTPLHASVESAFAKIAQAYVTLTDPAQRSAYDAKLAARERIRSSTMEIPKQSKQDRVRAEAAKEAAKKKQSEAAAENDFARAESSFQEGFIALQRGQIQPAIVSLASAARLAPGEARFRAYYGRALGAVEATRRLAEAELQAALKLDPGNFSYRLMLAQLYFDLGFYRRAESELKRVLAAEPNHPGAHKLLRRLESTATP